jgi:hypothetical protein
VASKPVCFDIFDQDEQVPMVAEAATQSDVGAADLRGVYGEEQLLSTLTNAMYCIVLREARSASSAILRDLEGLPSSCASENGRDVDGYVSEDAELAAFPFEAAQRAQVRVRQCLEVFAKGVDDLRKTTEEKSEPCCNFGAWNGAMKAELFVHLAHNMDGFKALDVEVDWHEGQYEVIVTYAGKWKWNKKSAARLHELIAEVAVLGAAEFVVFGSLGIARPYKPRCH